jgi:ferritin-like metal-binding protein YciE
VRDCKQLGFCEGDTLLKATLEDAKATDVKLAEFAEKAGNA